VKASSLHQPQEPPLVLGDRVYVTQRDVRAVECLDRDTGRLIWRYAASSVRRLAGVCGETAVIETADGFIGVQAENGEPRWRRDIPHLLEARLCSADPSGGTMVYARREATAGSQWRPSLVWLDVLTGRDMAVCPLPEMIGREPLLGPLVMHGQRLWLFSGDNTIELRRRFWELVPRGSLPVASRDDSALAFWLPSSANAEDLSLRSDVAARLGWALLSSRVERQTGWQAKWQNESDVVITMADAGHPARLIRHVSVPKTGSCRLVVQAGHEGGERWELEITAAGKSIFRGEVSSKTASGGWLRREADLTPLAGQTVWLSATARALDGKPARQAWAALDVKPPAK
jgi:hypothetical protein